MAGPGSIPGLQRLAINCTSDTKTTGSLTLCMIFCQEDPFSFAIEIRIQCKRWLIDGSVCRFFTSEIGSFGQIYCLNGLKIKDDSKSFYAAIRTYRCL